MYKQYFLIAIISILFGASCASSTGADDVTAKPTVDPASALREAENLYKKRSDPENVRRALKTLEGARDMDNRNFEIEYTYAQYSYFLGNDYETSDTEAEEVLKKGLTAAKIARRMKPDRPEGHFWYGAILGEQARRNPVTVGITSINEIKDSMQKVVEIDPTYQGASAYDGLGLLELKTAGLAGGDPDKAVELLEKGLEIEKNNSFLRVHLAEAYIAVGRKEDARKQIDFVLAMKPNENFLPEHERAIFDAKKLREEKL